LGIRGRVSRSTLADANETRDWRIYADLAQVLIRQARALYAGVPFAVELDETVYALDCTTIDLCLALFPWARYRRLNAAVKVHALLDLRGSIPSFIAVFPAQIHEIHILDQLLPEPGALYLMDRAYLDFTRLYTLTQGLASFIIRSGKDFALHRIVSRPVDAATGVRCDQTIRLKSFIPAHGYPDPLRRICYVDAETEKRLIFLTNNFLFPALTVAQLYKCRWQDQTTSAHRAVLRTFRERRENPSLDRHLRLRVIGGGQKTLAAGAQPLHPFTNSQRQPVRENPAGASTYHF
jgi:hypothetical protein